MSEIESKTSKEMPNAKIEPKGLNERGVLRRPSLSRLGNISRTKGRSEESHGTI